MIHTLAELSPFMAGLLTGTLVHFRPTLPRDGARRICLGVLVGSSCSLLAGELGHDVFTAALCIGFDTLAAVSGIFAAHFALRRLRA